ncbi:hypothetical protein BGZ97_012233 [Linnemannia gamsii]|uniref:F-box domain-containing protein n=1 Tax=Linnemannia gamsii TaxID=64522 RepID=A0A9P6R4I3_9FUNG|nr:hypothetical protein BGZ97_012233 [Linnemannia gamsii]
MDAQKDGTVFSILVGQLDKADITVDGPNNKIDNQKPLNSSTAPIHNISRHPDNPSSGHLCCTLSNNTNIAHTINEKLTTETAIEKREEGIECPLPSEIMITVFGQLSIQNLLVCQRVSRHFRVIARTVMLDKLGGQSMMNNYSQGQHCPQCRRNQQVLCRERSSLGDSTSATTAGEQQHGSSGLPPLPYHHLVNNPNTLLPTTVSPVSHNNSYIQPQDPSPQHQLHHHLYQHQSTEDMSQHHQTDLHIHHQSHSYRIQESRPTSQQSDSQSSLHHHANASASQYRHHTASYVAPGNIALFLFPYHDHTPTSWQDRQSVHFNCTGIDRLKEQLVFSPIYPEIGDCLKFNTNSWNLPSTFASGSFSGEGLATSFNAFSSISQNASRTLNSSINISNPVSINRFPNTAASTAAAAETNYSTGLDLFDYSTGRPRFPGSGQANTDSLNSTSYSFANHGHGGEHYSVIGIKHGDWPEDRQAAGRWWGGGLHSSMSQEAMVFMPWLGASNAFDFYQSYGGDGGGGRTLNNSSGLMQQDANMENASPTSSRNGISDGGCTKIHRHHMYLSSTRPRNPPVHHHRFLCLHHDQLMTDIAAASSSFSSSADPKSNMAKANKMPLTTAGSKHFEVDYGACVTESKRCLFCLSTPCKANLEIQVKFDELRVSLDWILSGFGLDQKATAASSSSSSVSQSSKGPAIADALAMGSARQGQVSS